MAIEELNSGNFMETVTQASLPVLVDFYADWCGPCKMLAPVLQQVADEYKDRIVVYKVNTDACPDLASQHDIKSIPCLISYKQGKLYKKIVGTVPKKELLELVDL